MRIEYQVGVRDHEKITASSFVIIARYEDLINLPGNTFTARPRSTPPGVRRVRVRPEQVEFIIQEKSSETGIVLPTRYLYLSLTSSFSYR